MSENHNKFLISANCVVISFENNTTNSIDSTKILSLDKKNLLFPKIHIHHDNIHNINENIINALKQYVVTNYVYLIPQLISVTQLNSTDSIDLIYGFFIEYTNNINNSYWIPMDSSTDSIYYNLIYEVIQKLQ